MMDLCNTFSHFSEWYTRHKVRSGTGAAPLSAGDPEIPPALSLASHPSTLEGAFFLAPGSLPTPAASDVHLRRLEGEFAAQMGGLLEALHFFSSTEAACMGNLLARLDYNLYYTGVAR